MRDGWLYARGVADDKGQLYLLLKAAELLARDGALPVNVRFACDGEEETGGHSIVEFLAEDVRGADACVIFDSDMLAPGRPWFNITTRGLCYFHLRVRSGTRDLHSGIYGGSALNAAVVLPEAERKAVEQSSTTRPTAPVASQPSVTTGSSVPSAMQRSRAKGCRG